MTKANEQVSQEENAQQEQTAAPNKQEQAEAVIKSKMLWAMGAGLVPIPLFDIAAISGVQIKMLNDMSKVYEIPFSEHKVKNVLGSLVGGIGTAQLGLPLASLMKMIPLVGPISSFAAVPVMAGASTYAVGKVFIQHFESGGTFLDFDPAKVKDYFARQFEEGKKVAEEVKAAAK